MIKMRAAVLLGLAALGAPTLAIPQATATVTTTQIVQQKREGGPMCQHHADPGDGNPNGNCVCTSGATTTTVAIDTDAPLPCPWTAFPLTSATSAPAPAQVTVTGLWTTTDISVVNQCTQFVVSRSAQVDVTSCLPPTTVISHLPQLNVEAGATSRQQVGELAGPTRGLYSSVHSALETLCPTPPADGTKTSCKGTPEDKVVLNKVGYYTSDCKQCGTEWNEKGTLTISMGKTTYDTLHLRDSLINSTATTFQMGANNDKFCDKHTIGEVNRRVCTAPGYVYYEYLDEGKNGLHPEAYMLTNLDYWQPSEGGNSGSQQSSEACEIISDVLVSGLAAVAPQFAVGDIQMEPILNFACEKAWSDVDNA